MKKLHIIIMSFVIVLGGFIGLSQTDAQIADSCFIEEAYFTPIKNGVGIIPITVNAEEGGTTTLHVKSSGCDDGFSVLIRGMKLSNRVVIEDGITKQAYSKSLDKRIDIRDERIGETENEWIQLEEDAAKILHLAPKPDGTASATYAVDGHGCYDDEQTYSFTRVNEEIAVGKLPFDCYFYPEIISKGSTIFDGSSFLDNEQLTEDIVALYLDSVLNEATEDATDTKYQNKEKSPVLFASCDGGCNDYHWDLNAISQGNNSLCKLNSVSFTEIGGGSSITNKVTTLVVDSENCVAGLTIDLFYYNNGNQQSLNDEEYGSVLGSLGDPFGLLRELVTEMAQDGEGVHKFSHRIENYPEHSLFIPPQDRNLQLQFITTELPCSENGGTDFTATLNADCRIGVVIRDKATGIIGLNMAQYLRDNFTLGVDLENFSQGALFAECNDEGGDGDTDCDFWKGTWILQTNNAINSTTNPQFIGNDIKYDTTNPCYVEAYTNEQGIDIPRSYDPNCYEFLAPLPGIELDENQKQDSRFIVQPDARTGKNRIAIRDISTYQLGSFINKIFQIAVAILAVISVIMIIVAGVQYMTVESLFGKTDAKQRIVGASTGLILSLGIYIILNTINPQLLEVNFGRKLVDVEIDGGGLGINMNLIGPRGSGGSRSLDEAWAKMNAPALGFKNTAGGSIEVRACDTDQFETYDAFNTTVRTRRELKPTIQRISDKWKAMGDSKYPIKSIGGYNCRVIKAGGSDISTHSYGVTLDINPDENPYLKTWTDRASYTDMPASFVKLFTDEGFGWGGNWTSLKDAMHFSKTTNEQGNAIFN